ncbi:HAD family hydrolase [Actinoplanes sp. NPDC051494]|uniref:HAD family hydrolase n=1 Tax=Actinoplanes sp. NPDC051494 TaxID=3363907 RepID=UPI0037B57E39
MTNRAVLLDIGGVLEITPATGYGARWERRLGLEPGELDARMGDLWAAGGIGTVSEAEVERGLTDRLGLDPVQLGEFLRDLWGEYLGSANDELIAYVTGLRGRCRLGILSNSFVGAREREEAAYGFGSLVEEILYSHEIGLVKPDPAAFALAADRLRTAPADILFVDDAPGNIAAARAAGLRAVLFEDNQRTIECVDAFLR